MSNVIPATKTLNKIRVNKYTGLNVHVYFYLLEIKSLTIASEKILSPLLFCINDGTYTINRELIFIYISIINKKCALALWRSGQFLSLTFLISSLLPNDLYKHTQSVFHN